MQVTFLVRGLGEYSQAFPIAAKLKQDNHAIIFLAENKLLCRIITADGFKYNTFDKPQDANRILAQDNSDALFLCNSHTTGVYNLERPKKIPKIFSLDSNWLFNNQKYEKFNQKFLTYPWIDTIYVVFPSAIFRSNLQQAKGNYTIADNFISRIVTPGFVPEGIKASPSEKAAIRTKLGLRQHEKLVLTYFSRPQFHSSSIKDYGKHFALVVKDATSEINKASKIQVRVLDFTSYIETKKAVLSSVDFDKILATGDVVIMHYGYGTLSKILRSSIPVLCFLPKPENQIHSNFFELKPCIDANAIDYLFFDQVEPILMKKKLEMLLFNQEYIETMQTNQKRIFQPGENTLIKHFYQQFNLK